LVESDIEAQKELEPSGLKFDISLCGCQAFGPKVERTSLNFDSLVTNEVTINDTGIHLMASADNLKQ